MKKFLQKAILSFLDQKISVLSKYFFNLSSRQSYLIKQRIRLPLIQITESRESLEERWDLLTIVTIAHAIATCPVTSMKCELMTKFICLFISMNYRGTVCWTRWFLKFRSPLHATLSTSYGGTSRGVHPINFMLITFLNRFPLEFECRGNQAHVRWPLLRTQFHCTGYFEPLEFTYKRQ